jgi:hypothetical protein
MTMIPEAVFQVAVEEHLLNFVIFSKRILQRGIDTFKIDDIFTKSMNCVELRDYRISCTQTALRRTVRSLMLVALYVSLSRTGDKPMITHTKRKSGVD